MYSGTVLDCNDFSIFGIIRTGKSDDILKQVMINVNPMIWFKSCNTNLLIIIIIINKNINGSQSPKSKFIVQHTFNMFKKAFYYIQVLKFLFLLLLLLLFITLFIIFFLCYHVIVIKITPDFFHKYR